jgi:hypothetical protein
MPSSSRPPPTTDRLSQVWQARTDLVKQERDAASAAMDAKTARLRELRLAKEAEEAQAGRDAAQNKPARKLGAKRS